MLKRESRKHDSEFEFEITAFFNYKFAENLSLGKLLLQFSQKSLNLGDFIEFWSPPAENGKIIPDLNSGRSVSFIFG